MIPNAEKIVVQHLLADEALTEIIGENRVSTTLPEQAPLPRIRVTLAGGTIAVRGWLYSHRIGIEAWADDKDTAWNALSAAIASLETGLDAALVEGGVVSAIDQETGIAWIPDPETQTPRYLTTVRVTVHPEP